MKLLVLLFLTAITFGAGNYTVNQSGNILQVTSPWGSKLFFGDNTFKDFSTYQLELNVNDLRPQNDLTGNNGGAGGNGSPNQGMKPYEMDNVDELIAVANKFYNQGKFTESLQYIDEILNRDNKHIRAHIMKGSLLHILGNKSGALKEWARALELDPKNQQLKKIMEAKQ